VLLAPRVAAAQPAGLGSKDSPRRLTLLLVWIIVQATVGAVGTEVATMPDAAPTDEPAVLTAVPTIDVTGARLVPPPPGAGVAGGVPPGPGPEAPEDAATGWLANTAVGAAPPPPDAAVPEKPPVVVPVSGVPPLAVVRADTGLPESGPTAVPPSGAVDWID
jgi:hypothetical protein